jgi:cysteine desulfurase
MSGGTEADNCILRSAVRDLGVKHLVSSKIEHHAVTHTLDQLAIDYPIKISYVKLDELGNVDYDDLELILKSSNSKTLVTLMHINNELGNILDINLVSNLCIQHKSLFHSDTVQSVGHYKLDLSSLNIDFLVASAHKFHGPKGIGFAYINKKNPIKPLIFGGSQEKGCRAGTESVHNIIGMSDALDISMDKIEAETKYIKNLKSYFIDQLKDNIKGVKFNGASSDLEHSTYTLVNVRFPIVKEESALFLFQLDMKGIACSKGSACQSGADSGSHVLNNVLSEEENKFISLRFSFSFYNTVKEVDYVISELKELLNK